MFEVIGFMINGEEFTNERLTVTIPDEYADRFSGFNFKDMHEFSQALMFANCAHEARMNGKAHLLRINENCLNNVFK